MTMKAFKLISKHDVDFDMLLASAFQMLGKKVSHYSDNVGIKMGKGQAFGCCLASMVGLDPKVFSTSINQHIMFTGLCAFEQKLCNDIISAGNLRWLGTPANEHDCVLGVLTGDLNEWRDAVIGGLKWSPEVNSFYSIVLREFRAEGYKDLWGDFQFTEGGGLITIENNNR